MQIEGSWSYVVLIDFKLEEEEAQLALGSVVHVIIAWQVSFGKAIATRAVTNLCR